MSNKNYPTISIETNYFEPRSILRIYENTKLPHENRFFFQVQREHKLHTEIQYFVRDKDTELNTQKISLKQTQKIQDAFLDVIDNPSTGSKILFGNTIIDFVHLPNGEIGIEIDNKKYLVPKNEINKLRAFCAKIFN